MQGTTDAGLDDEDYQAQAGFRHAIARFAHASDAHTRAAGLTPQQYLLLLALRGHPAYPLVTVKDLAQQLEIRPHSASLLIDRAARGGLLARAAVAGDRRKKHVALTAEGERALEQVVRANRRDLRLLAAQFEELQRSLRRAAQSAARAEPSG